MSLGAEQIDRYSRQIVLPEIGGRGQERLLSARVLVAGGGLIGEIAATYLTAAGVGFLNLVSADEAEMRRIETRLRALNPDVACHCDTEPVRAADLVVDLSGDGPLRTALHLLASNRRIPLLCAEASGWTASAALFESHLGGEPCVLCLPTLPACGAPMPAVAMLAGAMAATEAVRICIGRTSALRGRRWLGNVDTQTFETVQVSRCGTCAGCNPGVN